MLSKLIAMVMLAGHITFKSTRIMPDLIDIKFTDKVIPLSMLQVV